MGASSIFSARPREIFNLSRSESPGLVVQNLYILNNPLETGDELEMRRVLFQIVFAIFLVLKFAHKTMSEATLSCNQQELLCVTARTDVPPVILQDLKVKSERISSSANREL